MKKKIISVKNNIKSNIKKKCSINNKDNIELIRKKLQTEIFIFLSIRISEQQYHYWKGFRKGLSRSEFSFLDNIYLKIKGFSNREAFVRGYYNGLHWLKQKRLMD